MKLFIVLFALIAIAYADEDWHIQSNDDLVRYRNECVGELNVPEEYVEKFKRWEFPEDDTTKHYINCVFPKLGLFDTEHGFNVEHLVQQLGQNRDHAEVRVEVEKCVDDNSQGTDSSEWVYRGFKCFIDNHLSLVRTSIHH